jgi:hypothetical protein
MCTYTDERDLPMKNFKQFFYCKRTEEILYNIMLLAWFPIILNLTLTTTAWSQDDKAYLRLVRTIETIDLGIPNPAGLTFSPEANAFLIMPAVKELDVQSSFSNIHQISPVEKLISIVQIPADVTDPTNLSFDSKTGRLLMLQFPINKILEIGTSSTGYLDSVALTQFDTQKLGLQNPQGLAVDPTTGFLFILDSAKPRILQIEPDPDQRFDMAVISEINLRPASLENTKGLAFDPTNGHLHLFNPATQLLFEITRTGQVVNYRDLSGLDLIDPLGMVFAPSGDLTDSASQMSLYIADSGRTDTLENGVITSSGVGKIVELSLTEPVALTTSTSLATLVQSIDTSLFDPPSPDPAGIVYLDPFNRLLVSDSEVNEMSIFSGDNLFEMTLTGILTDTLTTVSFSDEPTGVAYNPTNGHIFFTDDDAKEIFKLDPGPDQLYGTSDDLISSFDTTSFNSYDPEGITFDSWQNVLFIVDGLNSEVYRIAPGPNGVFDGPLPEGDDQISSFDIAGLGIIDPEGIAFNPDNGNLFIIGYPTDMIAEISTTGNIVRLIDISQANPVVPAGLACEPGSLHPSEMNIYIADRGIDNNQDPNENDGKIYEFSIPPFTPDTSPPEWDGLTIGIGSAIDIGTGGKVTVEFDTAFDDVDGTNVRFNIYYAESTLWNDSNWNDAAHNIVYNVTTVTGSIYAHAFTVANLVSGVAYTFGVRVEDQSGNEDTNVVKLTATPTGIVTELIFQPVADSFVNGNQPDFNYGSQNPIEIDGLPEKVSYLRFNVTGIIEIVQSAYIRLMCTNGGPGGNIYTITDNSWDEFTVTYNSRPIIDGPFLDSPGDVDVDDIVEFDVLSAIAGNAIYNFALDSTFDNGVHYLSREDLTNPPLLIINLETSEDTTAPVWDDPVSGVGVLLTTDTTTGGSVTVEFDTATDAVDGTNLKFNLYYAPSTSWNPADWNDPAHSVLGDVTLSVGTTYTHAYTVSSLTDNDEYIFGVRVEDQSGNEDDNTQTLPATPTLFVPDTTAPVWDDPVSGVGVLLTTDTTTGGSVTVEFDTATDAVDGTNLKFNLYYAPSTSWNPADWNDPAHSVLGDVTLSVGTTYTHAYTVSSLTDNDEYTFGVRVEDQSGNEDANTITETATSTSDECVGDLYKDGKVDELDLVIFSEDFGRSDCTSDCEGDFDVDDDVDASDFAEFVSDFGRIDCP